MVLPAVAGTVVGGVGLAGLRAAGSRLLSSGVVAGAKSALFGNATRAGLTGFFAGQSLGDLLPGSGSNNSGLFGSLIPSGLSLAALAVIALAVMAVVLEVDD